MSELTLQWIATLAIVALAAFFLIRHMIISSRPEQGPACGSGCGSCGKQDLMEKRLASLDEN